MILPGRMTGCIQLEFIRYTSQKTCLESEDLFEPVTNAILKQKREERKTTD